MRKIIGIIILSIFSLTVVAQKLNKPLRVEIEAKSASDAYVIIPFGEKGVILFYEDKENSDRDNHKWMFSLYNTDFKEVWTKEQNVIKNMKYMYFYNSSKYLYLYFETIKSFSSSKTIQLLKINVDSASISTYSSSIPLNADITEFKVINNVAMLSGHTNPSSASTCLQMCLSVTCLPYFVGLNVRRYKPFLFQYNMNYGTFKEISEPLPHQAYVQNLAVDDKDSLFVASIKNFIPYKTNAMYINKYLTDGTKLSSQKLLTHNENRKINTAKLVALSENNKIFIGTYSNNTKGARANPAFVGVSEPSTGIYFTTVVNDEQKFIKFYNFSKFKSFYAYLSEHRTAKILKKEKKLEKKGKELSFDYRLLIHDIIKKDSNYIMVAEAYFPEYHTVSYVTYTNGVPVMSSYQVFDGYRYTNAIVACFDKDGELLWDNSFEIWNILTFNLHERVKVLFDNNDIILTYSTGGNIASKIIRNNEVVEGKQYTKIETNYDNDKVLNDYNSDMDFWYGSYFISYGFQKIKNTSQDKTRRMVFYFNKIAFQ